MDILLDNIDFKKNNIELAVIGGPVLGETNIRYPKKENVRFLGWVDNNQIDEYIKYCDALIVPSRWEGFGLVALEAMKNKKMIISSDVGGLNELVKNGVNGIKFNPISVPSLKTAIDSFSRMSKEDVLKMGSNGECIFHSKYNNDMLCKKLLDIYMN